MKTVAITLNVTYENDPSESDIKNSFKEFLKDQILISSKFEFYTPSYNKGSGRKALRKIIQKRDGDLCHWCKEPLDWNCNGDQNLSPTIEHLKRKSDGGAINDLDNLALAHKVCNNNRHHKK